MCVYIKNKTLAASSSRLLGTAICVLYIVAYDTHIAAPKAV